MNFLIFSFTTSPGEKTFEVQITSPTDPYSRIWVQILDRNDGSFLVRYRMYASYTDLHIQILLKDKLVGKSPYVLRGEKNQACFHDTEMEKCLEVDANLFLTTQVQRITNHVTAQSPVVHYGRRTCIVQPRSLR